MSNLNLHSDLINALREKAAEILPPGSRFSLYGSRARGDARPDSDWDIHILIPGDEHLPLTFWDKFAWPFADVGLAFNEIITPRLYSFAGWVKRSFLPFYKNVESEKLILLQK